MSFVKVTANYGSNRLAAGIYELNGGSGLWEQVTPGNANVFEFITDTWRLQDGDDVLIEAGTGGASGTPASAAWVGYRVEAFASPGDIPEAGGGSPSSPGQLPASEGGGASVTSPGSILPQAAGSPSSPGAVNPQAPGVPDNPENYVGTFDQSLTERFKSQARDNIEASGPINVLIIAQSNLANGRDGGDIFYNPDVKIWVDDSNDNAGTSEFQSWDLSLAEPQHSWPNLVAGIGNNKPGANRNKWSHSLARRIQRATRRPVHIVQAAQSGTPLQHWITAANGGEQEIWDYLVTATTSAGIERYDLILYDHGENGVGAMGGTYEAATRLLRDQLEAAGYIDDSTTFLAREINTGAVTPAVETVWITERNGNGRIYPNDDFVYDGDGVHITGVEHDDVARGLFDFLLQRSDSETPLVDQVRQIDGAALWLDASNLPLADGDAVEDWVDCSGSGNPASQTTASIQPTFAARSKCYGMPAVRFDGTEWVFTKGFLGAGQEQALTVFGVIAPSTGSAMSWLGIDDGTMRFSSAALQDPFYAGSSFYMATTDGTDRRFVAFRYDGANVSLWRDGGYYDAVAKTGNLGITGGDVTIGNRRPLVSNIPFTGDIAEILVFDRALSDAEVETVHAYLKEKYEENRFARRLVFEGDSLTYGQGANTSDSHYVFKTLAGLERSWLATSMAVPSQRLAEMTSDAATQITPLYDARYDQAVLVVWAHNDTDDIGGAATHVLLKTYCQARQSEGWKVVVLNALPRTSAGFNTERAILNPLIEAEWNTYADALADIAADPDMGNDGDELDATYFSDGIHLTSAGYQKVADIVVAAIEGL